MDKKKLDFKGIHVGAEKATGFFEETKAKVCKFNRSE